MDHYLSLFFIPLFPVKKGAPLLRCENCGAEFDEEGNNIKERYNSSVRRCIRCGRGLASDFTFCPSCGKKL